MSSRYPVGPTETERCIESLLAVFQRYAGKDGSNCTLSKQEFKSFMNTELASFTKNQKDPGVIDRMMKKLDMNSDGQLDFSEFLNLIGGLAVACHCQAMSSPTDGSHKRL
uniref:Protein S100 n=1 Tax=Ailuropoda melanoleuca TaxID=9646 RepID=A0A7N5JCC2_AILME